MLHVLTFLSVLSFAFSNLSTDRTTFKSVGRNENSARCFQIKPGVLVVSVPSVSEVKIETFNSSLVNTFSYSKSFTAFSIGKCDLIYSGPGYFDFIVDDLAKQQRVFFRLDTNLQAKYVSSVFKLKPSKCQDSIFEMCPERSQVVLASHRFGIAEWEVLNIKDSLHDQNSRSYFQMSEEFKLENYPLFKVKWKFQLPSSPQYAKIFSCGADRVYAYLNFDTEVNEQYVYCFNTKDGALVYSTKLSVPPKNIWLKNFTLSTAQTTACVFSNYTYDSVSQSLFIGGTCEIVGLKDSITIASGYFIVRLSETGKITASIANDGYYLNYPQQTENDGAHFEYPRNANTYYRITAMSLLSDHSLFALVETYSLINKYEVLSSPLKVQRVDTLYHHLINQCLWLTISSDQIKPRNSNYELKIIPYRNNPHLDSVKGFIPKQTKLFDQGYVDDVNRLADPDGGHLRYVRYALDDSGKNLKILWKDSVQSGALFTQVYFSKTIYTTTYDNCTTLQSPFPLEGQEIGVGSEYYVRDYQTLYKFTARSRQYDLNLVAW